VVFSIVILSYLAYNPHVDLFWPGSSGVEQRTENPCVGGSNPPLATNFKSKNMHEVYVFRSDLNRRRYIGYSQNVEWRLMNDHNQGKVRSTKTYQPWKLIYRESYKTKSDATKRENELKRMKGSSGFKMIIGKETH
jgi:putative endonuclease